MVELNPPLHLQNRTDHSSQGDRLLLRSLWRVGGRAQAGDCTVAAQGSPNMSVTVSSGAVIVPGTENAFQGTYHCFNDASVTVAIAASDVTNPRIDLIVAKVQDAFYSGAVNSWSLAAVTGTPAGSPVAPAAPANSVILATITVAANATTITNANIVNSTAVARKTDSQWQAVVAGTSFEWYSSAGVLLGAIDSTGHVKSFGTTGGATKTRKPMAKVVATAGSINSGVATKIVMAAAGVAYDTDGMFSDANDWFIINTPGIYKIRATIDINWTNATGTRQLGIMVNNSFIQDTDKRAASAVNITTENFEVEITRACNAGDTFFAQFFHTAGVAMTIVSGSGYEGAVLTAEWLAPLS